jgi:hypothetical protein
MNPQPSYKNFLDVYFFNNEKDIKWYLERGGKYVVCLDDCDRFIEKGYFVVARVNKYTVLANENANKIFELNSDACIHSEIKKTFNSISFYYNCQTNSKFYLNAPFSDNWSALINNEHVVVQSGEVRMSVELGLGAGRFVMKYEPTIYRYLLFVGLFFIIFIPIVCLIFSFKKNWLSNAQHTI